MVLPPRSAALSTLGEWGPEISSSRTFSSKGSVNSTPCCLRLSVMVRLAAAISPLPSMREASRASRATGMKTI
ncbi:hypothetical protein D3C81_2107630 [compost metagenome]